MLPFYTLWFCLPGLCSCVDQVMLVRPQAEKDKFTAFVVARVRPRDADASSCTFLMQTESKQFWLECLNAARSPLSLILHAPLIHRMFSDLRIKISGRFSPPILPRLVWQRPKVKDVASGAGGTLCQLGQLTLQSLGLSEPILNSSPPTWLWSLYDHCVFVLFAFVCL